MRQDYYDGKMKQTCEVYGWNQKILSDNKKQQNKSWSQFLRLLGTSIIQDMVI